MAPPSTSDRARVTEILRQSAAGDRAALDRIFPLVYDELRRLARRHLAGQGPGRTMSTTVLIHEAYLRLVDQDRARFEDRAHFFGYASRVMRAILVDAARTRSARKRGGDRVAVPLDGRDLPVAGQADLVLAIDQALTRLTAADERLARIVECRFFGGLTDAETGEALGLSDRTVRREWTRARTWLHGELSPADA